MKTFEERALLLKTLGVKYTTAYEYRGEVGPNRKRHELELFDSIHLPFTPDEWCRLCMNEGDLYIGGCCGNLSNLQDYLNSWFREGGYVRVADLAMFANSIFDHEGFEYWNDNISILDMRKKITWKKEEPLNRLALIWKIVKDFYSPERPLTALEEVVNDPYTFMSDLKRSLDNISWNHIIKSGNKEDTQSRAGDLVRLSRMLAPLKKLNDTIDCLKTGPIVGLAIVSKEQPDVISFNSRGLCIYGNEEEVRSLFDLWDREAAQYQENENKKPARETHMVRRVSVSADKGAELGDIVEV